ncbi:MAG: hypothetical protein SVS15_06370 [Thermodesulfobacteriota bacterium]|nr:hypothetical protein [Thermodesulfobacteriota bacterium]
MTPRKFLPACLAGVAVILVIAAAALWPMRDRLFNKPAEPVSEEAPKIPFDPKYMTQIPSVPGENATTAQNKTAHANATGQEPLPESDKVVTPDFIKDLARFTASCYHPAGTRHNRGKVGLTTCTFKKLNIRYGVRLTGLAHQSRDPEAAREEIFAYAFNPITLKLIYDIYANDFILALTDAVQNQTREFLSGSGKYVEAGLGPEHAAEMLRIHARLAADTARCFQCFARKPDLVSPVAQYFRAAQKVLEAYGEYASLEVESADAKALDKVSEKIKQAIMAREKIKNSIISGIRPKAEPFSLSEGDVLDMATWVYRRVSGHPERINAVGAVAALLLTLAEDLEKASGSAVPAQ